MSKQTKIEAKKYMSPEDIMEEAVQKLNEQLRVKRNRTKRKWENTQ